MSKDLDKLTLDELLEIRRQEFQKLKDEVASFHTTFMSGCQNITTHLKSLNEHINDLSNNNSINRELEEQRRDIVELSKDIRIGILQAQIDVLKKRNVELTDQVTRLQNAAQRREM